MDSIMGFDTWLLRLVNTGTANPVFDVVMPFVTDVDNFIVVIALSVAGLALFGRGKGRWTIALIVLAVVTGDLTASLVKKTFARVRPCHELEGIRLLTGCGGAFSFPSAHATNIFASMVVLALRYRKAAPAFLSLAVVVAYSRVYVGVHYPLDVAAGAGLGAAIALAVTAADARLGRRLRGRAVDGA